MCKYCYMSAIKKLVAFLAVVELFYSSVYFTLNGLLVINNNNCKSLKKEVVTDLKLLKKTNKKY